MLALRRTRLAGLAALVAGALVATAPAGLTVNPARQDEKKAKADDKKDDAKADGKKDEKKADGKKVKSTIKVTVPNSPYEDEFKVSSSGDAVLKIEDQVMAKPTGTVREFVTPDLDAGKEYEYKFTVVYGPNNYTVITRHKTVVFKAGDPVVADLTKPDAANPDAVKIRWVPTPDDLVDRMIELAGVKDTDVVYEPGPGDGKVLIAAAKKGAKKCVGIELDPDRVKVSTGKVKDAKLEDKIAIKQGDALKADYSEATVIFMYMGDDFGREIGPVILKQCKPGTRIVSHRFLMGDWKPEKTLPVTSKDDLGYETELHLWVVKDKDGKIPAEAKKDDKKDEKGKDDKKDEKKDKDEKK
ncbi:MAG: TIGR03000 domain-containing protein [Gemmataceae bacterium]|nr:TIGR03000 domain-containing protein [Gemmataceae bacterium]